MPHAWFKKKEKVNQCVSPPEAVDKIESFEKQS